MYGRHNNWKNNPARSRIPGKNRAGVSNRERKILMSLSKALWDFISRMCARLSQKMKGWVRVQISFLKVHVWCNKEKIMFQLLDDFDRMGKSFILIYKIYLFDYSRVFFNCFIHKSVLLSLFCCPCEYPNHWNTEYRSLTVKYECNYLNNV